MKKFISTTIVLAIASLNSVQSVQSVHAASDVCGQISTQAFAYKADQRFLFIEKHNGKKLRSVPLALKNISSDTTPRTLSLAPGYHEFMTGGGLYFGLTIEANKKYMLIGELVRPRSLIPGKSITVNVRAVKDIKCSSPFIRPALAQPKHLNESVTLPPELTFKINALTKDLQKFYNVKNKKISVILPQRLDGSFGVVVDSQSSSPNGLLVLSVSPHTAAAVIGLQAQDIILSFNKKILIAEKKHPMTTEMFKNGLANISHGESISLNVKRGDKIINLTSEYSDIYLPEIHIEIN